MLQGFIVTEGIFFLFEGVEGFPECPATKKGLLGIFQVFRFEGIEACSSEPEPGGIIPFLVGIEPFCQGCNGQFVIPVLANDILHALFGFLRLSQLIFLQSLLVESHIAIASGHQKPGGGQEAEQQQYQQEKQGDFFAFSKESHVLFPVVSLGRAGTERFFNHERHEKPRNFRDFSLFTI